MNFPIFLSLVLATWIPFAVGEISKENLLPNVLRFGDTTYMFDIKETHGIGHTKLVLKTFGCGESGITYKILEDRVPFEINAHSGKLSVKNHLNYAEKKIYSFIVEATANNKMCHNEKAITRVEVSVLQHNKYRPQFKESKYYCRIQEETGHVKISPEIKVFDKDNYGPAGKISNVQVRESEQPFVLELEEATGKVFVKAVSGYKFNAQRMASYKFSLQAWDNGDPPRNSPPVKIHCTVVPQNRHAPVFKEKLYVGRVKEGEAKSNIVQVEAVDGDVLHDFGQICEYFIRTSDIPFSIDNKGIISLAKPLTSDAHDTYVFTVMAKDCGGKISEEATTVNVIVDKDCYAGFVQPNERLLSFKDCDGMIRLAPHLRLNVCGETRQFANFTATVAMTTTHILKGCDRESYEASGVFKMCKVNKTIDLLPTTYRDNNWMAAFSAVEKAVGANVYHFDKKTAVDVPYNLLQYTGAEKMTISTWIWTIKRDQQQYILAASDPHRLDRKHFALYTEGNKLVFVHRQEKDDSSQLCKSRFTWKPNLHDLHWHHILITVDGCYAAKLYVDSKEVNVSHVKEDWSLHGPNVAQRVVVGARWLGREQRYDDYFDGYLAGLSVNFGEIVDEQAIKCVYECKEQIKIDSPAPDGFEISQNSHNVIEIKGQGSPESFENILRSLVYVNTRRYPTKGHRPLQIQATINEQPLAGINLDVMVSNSENLHPKLSGSLTKVVGFTDLKKFGIRIAEKLTITGDKCAKYLDSARVDVEPPLSSEESLVNPGPLLDLYNLRKENLPGGRGLIIRGLATVEEYRMVLREIVFVHLGLEGLNDKTTLVYHKFNFTVSNLINRYVSNILQTEITTDKRRQYDMQAIGRQEKEVLPGAVDDKKTVESTGSSFGVMIGSIVAASCLFVFVILVVVVRMQRTTDKVYLDVSQVDTDTADQNDSSNEMNVTMNPLEKFDVADKEKIGQAGAKTLEWDDAYIA